MSHNVVSSEWKKLSEAASKEQDPQKLLELVTQLNNVLKEREDQRREVANPNLPKKYR